MKLVHTPGHKMIQSDALSRRPDLCPEEDNDNEDVIMLPENVFIDLIDEGLQRRIAKANDLDKDVMDALQLLLMDPPVSKTKEFENWTLDISNGYRVLLYKGKSYIPKDVDL